MRESGNGEGAATPAGAPTSAAPDALGADAGVGAAIARRAGRGLRWSLLATAATKVGSFAMGLVLARLLAPADFGLYAIALAATGFVMHINDVGLIAATVQWRGKLEEVAPTATSLAALFSAVIYSGFYLFAPAFAELAGNPEAAPIVRLLTLVILIDGLTAVRVAALQRRFQQNRIAVANMIGFAVQAPLAIWLAAQGAGAYSFAGGQVAQAVVTGVLVVLAAHLPFRPGLDRTITRKLLAYGIPLAASLGVEAVLTNAAFVVVGRLAGAEELGFYLLAFNVSSWVANMLGTSIRYVSVAGFAQLSENDDELLSRGVVRAVPLLLRAVLPVAVLMGVLATPLIALLYGERWGAAAPVLAVLMAMAVIRLLAGLALDALMGAGATRAALWVHLAWAAALVPALVVCVTLDGPRGAAVANVVIGLLVALPLFGVALTHVGVRLGQMFSSLLRPALAAALAGCVAGLVARLVGGPPIVPLAVAGTAGMIAYIATVVPLHDLAPIVRRVIGVAERPLARAGSENAQ